MSYGFVAQAESSAESEDELEYDSDGYKVRDDDK